MTNALRSAPVSRLPTSSPGRCRVRPSATALVVGRHGRRVLAVVRRRRAHRRSARATAIGAGGEYHATHPGPHPRHPRARRSTSPPLGRKPFTTNGSDGLFNVSVVGTAGLQAFADDNGDCADDNVLAVAVNITVVNPGSVRLSRGVRQGREPVADLDPQLQAGRGRRQHGDPAPRLRRRALDPPGAGAAPASADVVVDIFGWFSSSTFGTRGAPARAVRSRPHLRLPRERLRRRSRSPAASSARSTSAAPPRSTPVIARSCPTIPTCVGVLVNVTGVNTDPGSAPTFVSLLPAPMAAGDCPPRATSTCGVGQVRSNLAIVPTVGRRQASGSTTTPATPT